MHFSVLLWTDRCKTLRCGGEGDNTWFHLLPSSNRNRSGDDGATGCTAPPLGRANGRATPKRTLFCLALSETQRITPTGAPPPSIKQIGSLGFASRSRQARASPARRHEPAARARTHIHTQINETCVIEHAKWLATHNHRNNYEAAIKVSEMDGARGAAEEERGWGGRR